MPASTQLAVVFQGQEYDLDALRVSGSLSPDARRIQASVEGLPIVVDAALDASRDDTKSVSTYPLLAPPFIDYLKGLPFPSASIPSHFALRIDVMNEDGDILSSECQAIVNPWSGDNTHDYFCGDIGAQVPQRIDTPRVFELLMSAGRAHYRDDVTFNRDSHGIDVPGRASTYLRFYDGFLWIQRTSESAFKCLKRVQKLAKRYPGFCMVREDYPVLSRVISPALCTQVFLEETFRLMDEE
ncbi:MAG: hypothetical protein AB8H86_33310 [Polyangiales bacterium]